MPMPSTCLHVLDAFKDVIVDFALVSRKHVGKQASRLGMTRDHPLGNTAKPNTYYVTVANLQCKPHRNIATQPYQNLPACQPPRRRHFCIEDLGVSTLPALAISIPKSLLLS